MVHSFHELPCGLLYLHKLRFSDIDLDRQWSELLGACAIGQPAIPMSDAENSDI
jgi:hypothetical protein